MPLGVLRTTTPGSNGTHSPASNLAIFRPLRIIKRFLPSGSVRLSGKDLMALIGSVFSFAIAIGVGTFSQFEGEDLPYQSAT